MRGPEGIAGAADRLANPSQRSSAKKATLRRPMNASFDAETLRLLDETKEVYIETRRDGDSPEHRTIIWVVVTGGEVFVRSVRGHKRRWYREISPNPVRAAPATEEATIETVSDAIRSKYERPSPSSTAAMVRPEVLPTTLKL